MDNRSQAASDRSFWTRIIRYWTEVPSGRLHLPETDPFADDRLPWEPNTPYRTRHRLYTNPNALNSSTNAVRTNRVDSISKQQKPCLTEQQLDELCPTFAKRAHMEHNPDVSSIHSDIHAHTHNDIDERLSVCSYISSQFPWTNDACSICLDDIHPGSRMKRLPCGHEFHADCITKWVCQTNKCPYCKAFVKSITECVATERDTVQVLPQVSTQGPAHNQLSVQVRVWAQNQQQELQSGHGSAVPMQPPIAIMI